MREYEVQIPYIGLIPVINRRGPIRQAILNESQVKLLQARGVEIIDITTGKTLELPVVRATVAAATKEEKLNQITPPAYVVSDNTATPVTEESTEVQEDVAEVTEVVDETEIAENEVTEDDSVKVEGGNRAIEYFDSTKIEGYDSLSKSKQRKVRKKFIEVLGNVPEGAVPSDEDVAKAYAEVGNYLSAGNVTG